MRIASPIAIPYSFKLIVVNSKRSARAGISMTTVVSRSAIAADPQSQRFCFESLNSDCLRDLMLNEWNISVMDIVRNAIVMPSLLATMCHCPVSRNSPMKYAISTRIVVTVPW